MVDPRRMKQFAQPRKVPALIARRPGFLLLFVAVAALLAVSVGSVMAQTQTRTFPIRGGTAPFDITMAPDGNFWFTLANSSKVAVITPNGKIRNFRTPSLSNPAFMTVGPDGNVWFGEGSTGAIASATPRGTNHGVSVFLLWRECGNHYRLRWQYLV